MDSSYMVGYLKRSQSGDKSQTISERIHFVSVGPLNWYDRLYQNKHSFPKGFFFKKTADGVDLGQSEAYSVNI